MSIHGMALTWRIDWNTDVETERDFVVCLLGVDLLD